MTDHTHSQYVAGCYRCDLSRDEVASGYITDAMVEQAALADLNHWRVKRNGLDDVPNADEWRRGTRAALEAVVPDIIRQARAEAWGEGHAAGCTDPYAKYGECDCGPNPYRADLIEQGGQP